MCGIVGVIGKDKFPSQEVLERLKRLDYRGYDSFGIWDGTTLKKRVGRIAPGIIDSMTGVAISHTRWATHGGVTEANTHPHRAGKVTVVHNGIIENWKELRESLERQGHSFSSETDSEVIAHYLNHALSRGKLMRQALHDLIDEIEGTFAMLIMVDDIKRIFAAKRDSPLMLGIADGKYVIASDINAFCDLTKEAVVFGDNEYAIIGPESYEFMKGDTPITKQPRIFEWEGADHDRGEYEHFMMKEIHEQPESAARLIASLEGEQAERFDKLSAAIRSARKVIITACGTAYFASLMGAMALHREGINAQALIASEFENFAVIDNDTLVIAASQSGETMDTIEALKYARKHGAKLASIVNVPNSTIERLTQTFLRTLAGQEVAVASTKAFTNQIVALAALATGERNGTWARIPKLLEEALGLEPRLARIAKSIADKNHIYIIGRRTGYPIAREIALKIKEISYVHAEGMMGGELKHGTIALIEQGTPVISLVYDDDPRMRSNTQEVKARGAKTIVIGTRDEDEITLPARNEFEFGLLSAIVGQLLAYYIARCRGRPIDRPRNLAKSVTVH